MTKMIFLYGLPAAGKTTFAKKFVRDNPDVELISADEVREELYGSPDIHGNSLTIYSILLDKMRRCLSSDTSFIYDGTNMRKDYRRDFLFALDDYIAERIIIKFPMNRSQCVVRFFTRDRNIPFESVAHYFTMDEEPPSLAEGWDRIYTLEASR